ELSPGAVPPGAGARRAQPRPGRAGCGARVGAPSTAAAGSPMTYTGRVRLGGPEQRRDLPGLSIRKLSVGPMDNNAYLLTCATTGERLLVDAAAEPARLLALLSEESPGGRLAAVVTTHRHPDHHGALPQVAAATGAQVAAGTADA